MRLTGLLLVAFAGAALLGWYRAFEAACALGTLIILGMTWWMVRRSRRSTADEDEVYEPESPRAREFVLGILLGFAWLFVTAGAIGALAKTRIHALLVDEPGQALANELELLARNGAWSSILAKFDRPQPARIGPSARARIDRLHYTALTHAA